MLLIVNMSERLKPTGIHDYEVRMNTHVLAKFQHDRTPKGAPQCLRDAADAIEIAQRTSWKEIAGAVEEMQNLIKKEN